jgi:AcrR family transcriptional regulator
MAESSGSDAVRAARGSSIDPRPSRTKRAIVAAATGLAATGEEITVAAIVSASGVSKSSFYSHFGCLDELAVYISRQAFERIAQAYLLADATDSPLTALREGYASLVEHWVDNRELYAAASVITQTRDAYLRAVAEMAAVMESVLRSSPDCPPTVDPALASRFLALATYGLLDAWVRGEIEASEQQLTDQLIALTPAWLSTPATPDQG